jgi:hypothetical protein
MHKKYDHRLVVSYRSYKVRDICRLFIAKKLHEQTVRGWVNDGKLKAIWHGKTIFIYGAVLKKFLLDNNNQKRTLEFNQFRCFKCQKISTLLNNTITKLTTSRGGCILAVAVCGNCNNPMRRLYKADKQQQILESFIVQHNELVQISDSLCSPHNTNIKAVPKPAISEPLKNTQHDKAIITRSSTSKANINRKINSVSIGNTNINPQLSLF